jgi:hypothetical protein
MNRFPKTPNDVEVDDPGGILEGVTIGPDGTADRETVF